MGPVFVRCTEGQGVKVGIFWGALVFAVLGPVFLRGGGSSGKNGDLRYVWSELDGWEALDDEEKSTTTGPYSREDARVLASRTAEQIEAAYGVEGLADYLDAVAYWESRFNPTVAGDNGRSVGLYQLRPPYMFTEKRGIAYAMPRAEIILRDPVLSTVIASDHAVRAVRRARQLGARGDWLAVRRWWKFPSLVDDDNEDEEVVYGGKSYGYPSAGVRERFDKALRAVDLPQDFKNKRPDVSGYPSDVNVVLADLGLKL